MEASIRTCPEKTKEIEKIEETCTYFAKKRPALLRRKPISVR